MKLDFIHYKLQFKYPFRLSVGTRKYTDIIIVRISYKGHYGYGEASLPPYFNENIESVFNFIKKINKEKLNKIENIPALLKYVNSIEKDNTAAKAAIDIALHDLNGKINKILIKNMYGISDNTQVYSTYTLGMGTLSEYKDKLLQAKDFKIFKLKLGGNDDKGLVENYLRICDKPFCVDVNQGWNDKHRALEFIKWLSDKGVVFIEQPMPINCWKEMQWLYERSPVPLIADESIKRLKDIKLTNRTFHGVNIKLMKSTGIYEAYNMIKKARSLNLKIIIGCMAESSCAVAAARHLAPLADWADLDAPMMTVNDPFKGLYFKNGQLLPPKGYGLGINLVDNLTF